VSDLKAAPATAADFSAPMPDSLPDEAPRSIEVPPVVAVVVASNPGEHFAEMLASLGDQDYENLSVLVIDAGSDEPIADRVADVLPEAYLHRLTGDPGWSVAANQSMELVSGSPFLLFCHDDVALDDRCVSTLMTQIYRHNAGIAGPKMVKWDDRRRLLQLGMGADRFGVLVDQVERGEFDQQQYDAVRDVFVAPGGVQLVRADLFVTLGGFDPEIGLLGEDLDLCWRAHAVGARVLAVSDAAVRHRESMDDRLSERDQRKLTTRHRLRTVMVTATGRGRFLTVPLAMFLIVLEALYYLLTGRRGQARDMFSAIGWNLARLTDVRRRRRALRHIRQKSEREVRAFQIGGSAAVNSFSRGQFTAGQDRMSGLLGAIRSSFEGEDSGSLRDATVIGGILAVVLLFGSRHLLTRDFFPVGQMPVVPDGASLFGEWWGGWRSIGTGGPGNPPTALLFLALGRLVTFWSPWLFDQLILLGPVVIGAVGTFRLTRPLGSARSAAIAAAFYLMAPLMGVMYATGRWDSLVVYAAAPFLLGSLFRLNGVSPYGDRLGPAGFRVSPRSLPVLAIRYGFLVALVAAFVPAVVVVAVLMALALLMVSPLSEGEIRWREFGLATAVALVAPVGLHFPWTFDVMRSFSWRWLIGPRSPESEVNGMLDLVLFAPGREGPHVFGSGLVVAAVLGLGIALRKHVRFAVQAWAVALAPLVLLWLEVRGWMPVSLPAVELLLAPTLVGMAVAAALAVRALENPESLPRYVPRRLGYTIMGAALAVVSLSGVLASMNGAWDAPTQNFATYTSYLAESDEGAGRVLWIGDSSVVPLDTLATSSGLQYTVTDGGEPLVWGRWLSGPVGSTAGVGHHLDLARSGETVRLGRLLAPYGIDFVVVVSQLAPAPYEGPIVDPGEGIVGALVQQLDLERIPGVPNLIVYRNAASSGTAAVLPTVEAADAVTAIDQLEVDLSGTPFIDIESTGPGQWLLESPGGQPVLIGVPAGGVEVNGDDQAIITGFDGLSVVPSSLSGELNLVYPVPWGRRLGQVVQLLVVAVGAILAQTRRDSQELEVMS
jgi:GT2 family glycosyltransferase